MIKRAILRNMLRQQILRAEDSYEQLHNKVNEIFIVSWEAISAVALSDAIEVVKAGGDAEAVIAAVEVACGGEAMQSAVGNKLTQLTGAIIETGWKESGVGIAFNAADAKAIATIKSGNLFWVRQHWNSYTADIIEKIITDSFAIGGDSRANIAANLEAGFKGIQAGTQAYWTTLADHIDIKTRNLGRVLAFEEIRAEYVTVKAWLDGSTTPFCRAVNGKVLKVSDLSKQRNQYLDAVRAKDVDAVKQIWPMKRDIVTIPNNIGMPPYHFRCRTIVVLKI